jgi:hypothetical protein
MLLAAGRDNLFVPQLQLFSRSEVAAMRDRTKARDYSPEREQFRRDHELHRRWGLTQRHARKLCRLHGCSAECAAAGIHEHSERFPPPTRADKATGEQRPPRPTPSRQVPVNQDPSPDGGRQSGQLSAWSEASPGTPAASNGTNRSSRRELPTRPLVTCLEPTDQAVPAPGAAPITRAEAANPAEAANRTAAANRAEPTGQDGSIENDVERRPLTPTTPSRTGHHLPASRQPALTTTSPTPAEAPHHQRPPSRDHNPARTDTGTRRARILHPRHLTIRTTRKAGTNRHRNNHHSGRENTRPPPPARRQERPPPGPIRTGPDTISRRPRKRALTGRTQSRLRGVEQSLDSHQSWRCVGLGTRGFDLLRPGDCASLRYSRSEATVRVNRQFS